MNSNHTSESRRQLLKWLAASRLVPAMVRQA